MIPKIRQLRPAYALLFLAFAFSCKDNFEVPIQDEAWVPIYRSVENSKEIATLEPRAPITGGKIYAYGKYLFQLEPNLGIHVYELVDKRPMPRRFIQVYGAQEIAIRNGTLYTNNDKDIVSLTLTESGAAQLAGRVENVFSVSEATVPPETGYFECVDLEKGIVVGWELKENVRAKCKF